jgi:Na+/H+ antiporter NhaD/arsenite permease-like protein
VAVLEGLAAGDLIAAALFMGVVAFIIFRVIDETAAALAGLILLIIFTGYTAEDAFRFIDWNVIFILLGMWIITGYMIKMDIPFIFRKLLLISFFNFNRIGSLG